MRTKAARILLIFTALWLPLQAVAGITMKLGAPPAVSGALASDVQQAAAEACPYHHPAESVPAVPQSSSDDCEYCGVCHLAAGGYMPAAAQAVVVVPAGRSFIPSPAAERASHIPEPPQYPPKRVA